jgi:DtxR family transcriptional regulator, Mn-dependent transcriptional regulator
MNGSMSTMELSASLEDYLETIFFLSREEGKARPKDIAERMKVRAASVTGALKALAEKGLINYAPYASVTLTAEGREIAGGIAVKHEALLHFFTQVLGIDASEAEEFACSMEHTIPDHILQRFVRFAEYTEKCPNFNANWQENAEEYFCKAQGCDAPRCDECRLAE